MGLPGQGAEHTAAFLRAIKHKDLQRAKKMRQRCKGEKGGEKRKNAKFHASGKEEYI